MPPLLLDVLVAAISAAVQAAASAPPPPMYPGGALDSDCSHVADGLGGPGYQFIASCRGRSAAPNGQWAVIKEPEHGVALVGADDRPLDGIPNLSDAMPFVLFWSPRSDWFFANHYQGSTMERLRVFQIVNRTAVERSSVYAAAVREMVRRYPCVGRDSAVYASGWSWSPDGRRIAMTVYAHPSACHVRNAQGIWHPEGRWEILWMIGDAESGRIDPASVRVRPGGTGPMPTDGPYAAFRAD